MLENKIARQRVQIESPKDFFALIKKSPKYISWSDLVATVGCSSSSLKYCRRGARNFQGEVFLKLIGYLNEEQKNEILGKIKLLDKSWGQSKGGKQSIKRRKEKLGKEGFLNQMAKIRKNSNLSKWHKLMKKENPELYSQIQRKRWLNLLKIWESKEKRKKAIKSLKEKYGVDYFSSLGLSGASNQPLTEREKSVKNKILAQGFDVETHKTIFGFNFDFVYKKEDFIAVEEVMGFRKKKASAFFDILVLYEKYKKLTQQQDVPFFISTWQKVDLKYKIERFPLELLLWALEKGLIPVLMDSKLFNGIRENVICGDSANKLKITEFLKSNLSERKDALKKGALIQSKQSFDELEEKIHKKLGQMSLSPEGKKLLETRYGTFIVPDNYFKKNGSEVSVFVSKKDITGVIGGAALVKELVSPKIKTIGIILGSNKRKLKTKSQNALLKTYVNYFYNSLDEFEENFVGP